MVKHQLNDTERKLRAENAKQLIDNPLFVDALAALEKDYYEDLLLADSEAARQELIIGIKVLRDLSLKIRTWIMDGRPRPPTGVVA